MSKDRDEFNRYIPKIIFGKDQNERSAIVEAKKLIEKHLENTEYKFNIINTKNLKLFHGNHFSGTARMSSDISSGVVNSDLKVHNLNNLYICDSSVIPFFGNSNPGFTLMAFCKKLANHLKKL